ncbi:MAG: DUF86 domain-containing protein [Bacteroidales bacterium]|nr:DUF86 domain-containing protein [Bacteroidales bacterium]
MERSYMIYLEDMHTSMSRIIEYLGEKDFIEFKQNFMLVDAVVRNFEIIGEAAKNIPEKVKEKYPSIPWNKMYGLRNLISHEYFGIDYEMIWEISRNNLPGNREDLTHVIEKERNSSDGSFS